MQPSPDNADENDTTAQQAHLVGPFWHELRTAPTLHRWTLSIAVAMNIWLLVFTMAFVPYGVMRWGWGYNLG